MKMSLALKIVFSISLFIPIAWAKPGPVKSDLSLQDGDPKNIKDKMTGSDVTRVNITTKSGKKILLEVKDVVSFEVVNPDKTKIGLDSSKVFSIGSDVSAASSQSIGHMTCSRNVALATFQGGNETKYFTLKIIEGRVMAKYQYNDLKEFFGGCSENRVLPSAKRGPLEILTMTYDRDGRVSLITRNDGTRDEYSSDWQTIARRNPNGSTDYLQNTGEIDLGMSHGQVEPKKSAVASKVASAPVK